MGGQGGVIGVGKRLGGRLGGLRKGYWELGKAWETMGARWIGCYELAKGWEAGDWEELGGQGLEEAKLWGLGGFWRPPPKAFFLHESATESHNNH